MSSDFNMEIMDEQDPPKLRLNEIERKVDGAGALLSWVNITPADPNRMTELMETISRLLPAHCVPDIDAK